MAGWAADAAWGSCCWLFAGFFQRRGKVEFRAVAAVAGELNGESGSKPITP